MDLLIEKMAEALNIPLSETRPFSLEEKETLYASAYSLYEQGNYEVAAQLFTSIVLQAPFCDSSWKGLAAARQMQKDYRGSLNAWALTALLKEGDPLPHFHAAECYFSLGETEEALRALTAAESLVKENEEELNHKIRLLKDIYAMQY